MNNAADNANGGGNAGEVGVNDGALIVELPAYATGTAAAGDKLVIQNLLIDGIYYSLHINAPLASDSAPSLTEAGIADLNIEVYQQVVVATANDLNDGTKFWELPELHWHHEQ